MQISWQSLHQPPTPQAHDLPPAPREEAIRLASLGEPEALSRLGMLYLQAFDFSGANAIPYQSLDYVRLAGWLRALLALDPRSEYPLFAAARIYTEIPDPARTRVVLELVYEEFLKDPNRRWQWLSHAAVLAKHRLGDLALARRYAAAVQRHTTDPTVPLWAKQMEAFVLEDMNELEAAKIMLGGFLERGEISDPAEARYLQRRLEELEARLQASQK
jgi:hypothetical protein